MRTLLIYDLFEDHTRRLASFSFESSYEKLVAFLAVSAMSEANPYQVIHAKCDRKRYAFHSFEMAEVFDRWRGFLHEAGLLFRVSRVCYSRMSHILKEFGFEPLPNLVEL